MPGTSARDKCFKEATDAYNDTLPDGKKIKIEHQKPWAIGDNGKWSPLGPLESIWSYIKNLGSPPYRVPDWTLEIDGKLCRWITRWPNPTRYESGSSVSRSYEVARTSPAIAVMR